jgi:hypothetical protein
VLPSIPMTFNKSAAMLPARAADGLAPVLRIPAAGGLLIIFNRCNQKQRGEAAVSLSCRGGRTGAGATRGADAAQPGRG